MFQEYWVWFWVVIGVIIGLFVIRILYVLFFVLPYMGVNFKYLTKSQLFSIIIFGQEQILNNYDEESHKNVCSELEQIDAEKKNVKE